MQHSPARNGAYVIVHEIQILTSYNDLYLSYSHLLITNPRMITGQLCLNWQSYLTIL